MIAPARASSGSTTPRPRTPRRIIPAPAYAHAIAMPLSQPSRPPPPECEASLNQLSHAVDRLRVVYAELHATFKLPKGEAAAARNAADYHARQAYQALADFQNGFVVECDPVKVG